MDDMPKTEASSSSAPKKEDADDMKPSDVQAPDAEADQDHVVREIDVYFSPCIDRATQLYLFQYPLRPKWRAYDLDNRCEEVRMKPTSSEVEIDLTIDLNSKNYDSSADPRKQMKKQVLSTSWKPPRASGCTHTVGVLTGNKLHLSPIHSVVQLRPSMRHLNKKAPKQTEDSEEVWDSLKYHGVSSEKAAEYREKMIAGGGSPIKFSMSSRDYLNSMCAGTCGESWSSEVPSKSCDNVAASTSGSMPRNVMSEEAIKKALVKFFKSRKTCSFEEINQQMRELANSDKEFPYKTEASAGSINEYPDELRAVVEGVAVNIHGIWVPKSSPHHPEYDDLRDVVIALLVSGDDKLKRALIYDTAKNVLGKEPTKAAYRKVLQELCEYKGSSWTLKIHHQNPEHCSSETH